MNTNVSAEPQILNIHVEKRGAWWAATAEGRAQEEISGMGCEVAAVRLAAKLLGAEQFFFTKVRTGHYKAETGEGAPRPLQIHARRPVESVTQFGHEGEEAAPLSSACGEKTGEAGATRKIIELLGVRYLDIEGFVPVEIPRAKNPIKIRNRIKLATADHFDRMVPVPAKRRTDGLTLPLAEDRDNMLVGRACSLLNLKSGDDFFDFIQRMYLRGTFRIARAV